ncbi:MAG: bifunctional aspartate kinase/diaminopimelate decarboxylase, partial [Gammaproteobacteria bacterium]
MTAAPASGAQWIVLKFGGTSVSTRPRWDKIAAIAKAWRARGKHVLIVVSALSGITDKLKAICDGYADPARCRVVADEIIARHRAMKAELELDHTHAVDGWLARLEQL